MKKYLYTLFAVAICLNACKKPDGNYDPPCDAENSVIDRHGFVQDEKDGAEQFNYDDQGRIVSRSASGLYKPVTYTYYADGYMRSYNSPGFIYDVRIYFDAGHRIVRTSAYSDKDSNPDTEYLFSYDSLGRIQTAQKLIYFNFQGTSRRTNTDSVRYQWKDGDVVRSDRYLSSDTVHYSFASYQVYDYDQGHSGKQFFMQFCGEESPYLHPQVNWVFNEHILTKLVTLSPAGAVMDSTVYRFTFDSHDRIVTASTNSNNLLSTGAFIGATSSFENIVYRCK